MALTIKDNELRLNLKCRIFLIQTNYVIEPSVRGGGVVTSFLDSLEALDTTQTQA